MQECVSKVKILQKQTNKQEKKGFYFPNLSFMVILAVSKYHTQWYYNYHKAHLSYLYVLPFKFKQHNENNFQHTETFRTAYSAVQCVSLLDLQNSVFKQGDKTKGRETINYTVEQTRDPKSSTSAFKCHLNPVRWAASFLLCLFLSISICFVLS